MPDNQRQSYSIGRISNVDFKLLNIFTTIVDSGGFSQAQERLNIALSSISTAMTDLETRLGLTLCTRGRGGFALTQAGEEVYQHTQQLFGAVEQFNMGIAALKGSLTGELRIGIVDNSTMDPATRIPEIIHRFSKAYPNVHVLIKMLSSQEIEEAVINRSLDLGIGLFANKAQRLQVLLSFPVHIELYCGQQSSLFYKNLISDDDLRNAGYAHGFYSPVNQHSLTKKLATPGSSCYQSEGLAFLIMSGRYLGFLPRRYTANWVKLGEMKAVLPETFGHQITMSLVVQRGETPDRVTSAFLEAFKSVGKV